MLGGGFAARAGCGAAKGREPMGQTVVEDEAIRALFAEDGGQGGVVLVVGPPRSG